MCSRPREAQGGPGEAQGGPGRPREAQGGQGAPREAQGEPREGTLRDGTPVRWGGWGRSRAEILKDSYPEDFKLEGFNA